ncbi:MAG: thermonuclease family protein [Alphaproteobacteria bacterium]|nr:thermonuclease family protein [Alphaproteobacteria bacterium]
MKKLIAVLFLVSSAFPAAAEIMGNPTVIAGDILMVNGVRMHLHGIDAPELDQVCDAKGKTYRCGAIAKTALMDLVLGASVTCRLKESKDAPFAYAYCEAGGFDLSSNMVHTGWALADRAVTKKYVAVEKRAQKAKRGLWRGKFAKPWEWRDR